MQCPSAEPCCQYLAGQAPSSAVPTNHYTHMNRVRRQYERAVEREGPELCAAFVERVRRVSPHPQS